MPMEARSNATQKREATITLAVLSIYALDFAINAVQSSCRSLIVDTLSVPKQQLGSAWGKKKLRLAFLTALTSHSEQDGCNRPSDRLRRGSSESELNLRRRHWRYSIQADVRNCCDSTDRSNRYHFLGCRRACSCLKRVWTYFTSCVEAKC